MSRPDALGSMERRAMTSLSLSMYRVSPKPDKPHETTTQCSVKKDGIGRVGSSWFAAENRGVTLVFDLS